ncbi:MAG: hypothetical protein K8S56_08520 [Candidatus Cloacimonetes bacterium]|nr:hypothetical protein [Candidatus Cloacimonadota bacterium]
MKKVLGFVVLLTAVFLSGVTKASPVTSMPAGSYVQLKQEITLRPRASYFILGDNRMSSFYTGSLIKKTPEQTFDTIAAKYPESFTMSVLILQPQSEKKRIRAGMELEVVSVKKLADSRNIIEIKLNHNIVKAVRVYTRKPIELIRIGDMEFTENQSFFDQGKEQFMNIGGNHIRIVLPEKDLIK